MRIISLILLASVTAAGVAAQQGPEPKYYSYTLAGTVTDELGGPAASIYVCWSPAERPINGRIPCTQTDKNGRYNLSVSDVPDKYLVSATTYYPFLLAGGKSPGKALVNENGEVKHKRVKEYRSASSGMLIFSAGDEVRTVDLQLRFYRWSDAKKEYALTRSEIN